MKVSDLQEVMAVPGLPEEPKVVEVKPGSQYLLHVKAALSPQTRDLLIASFRKVEQQFGAHIAVVVLPADIALYEIKPAQRPAKTDAQINKAEPLDD